MGSQDISMDGEMETSVVSFFQFTPSVECGADVLCVACPQLAVDVRHFGLLKFLRRNLLSTAAPNEHYPNPRRHRQHRSVSPTPSASLSRSMSPSPIHHHTPRSRSVQPERGRSLSPSSRQQHQQQPHHHHPYRNDLPEHHLRRISRSHLHAPRDVLGASGRARRMSGGVYGVGEGSGGESMEE